MTEPETWLKLFRDVAAKVSVDVSRYKEDDIDYVLWNFTPYPMGSREQVATALERYLTDREGIELEKELLYSDGFYDGEDD